jgi:hypothetical protein
MSSSLSSPITRKQVLDICNTWASGTDISDGDFLRVSDYVVKNYIGEKSFNKQGTDGFIFECWECMWLEMK